MSFAVGTRKAANCETYIAEGLFYSSFGAIGDKNTPDGDIFIELMED